MDRSVNPQPGTLLLAPWPLLRGLVLLALLCCSTSLLQFGTYQQVALQHSQLGSTPEAKLLWLHRGQDQWARFQQRQQDPGWVPAPPPLWHPIALLFPPARPWLIQARGPPAKQTQLCPLSWYCKRNTDPG